MSSLYDVAPRLAEALAVERWNIWCAGDDHHGDQTIRDGDRWAETVTARHHTAPHRTCAGLRDHACQGVVDVYDIQQRILFGANRGQTIGLVWWKCRRCQASRSRHG